MYDMESESEATVLHDMEPVNKVCGMESGNEAMFCITRNWE